MKTAELALETLAKHVEELERNCSQRESEPIKDWHLATGMFTGSEFSKLIDEEARKIREAARLEFGE